MKLIPVLDLYQGRVVRGIAGRRAQYRPIQSALVPGSDPLDIAAALREQTGHPDLYLADLDGIVHRRPQRKQYAALARQGFRLQIDAGLRDLSLAQELLDAGAAAVVAGLETLPEPALLAELCNRCGPQRVLFCLDLHTGRPLGQVAEWNGLDPLEIAEAAVQLGVRRVIVLDLAAVGIGGGVPTLDLCRQIRQRFPDLQLTTGGGVRNLDDLHLLHAAGIDHALVASALHDGRLNRNEIEQSGESLPPTGLVPVVP